MHNWRTILQRATLTGLLKTLAECSQVLDLREDGVVLLAETNTLATHENAFKLTEILTETLGRAFCVEFKIGFIHKETVQRQKQHERQLERLALIESFKDDPLVKKILKTFPGKILEETIQKIQQ